MGSVKMSNFDSVDNGCDAFEAYIHDAFDNQFQRLLLSDSIEDLVSAFNQAELEIGKTEFVTCLMLYHLYAERKKVLSKLGYTSLFELITDLKKFGIGSRQSFYNVVKAGEILAHPFLFFNTKLTDVRITPNLFHKNYAKLPLLWKIYRQLDIALDNEVMIHFSLDSYVDFQKYFHTLQNRCKEEANKRRESRGLPPLQSKASIRKDKKAHLVDLMPSILESVKRIIYQEIKFGHSFAFFLDADAAFITGVENYLSAFRNMEYDNLERGASDIGDLSCNGRNLEDMELPELVKDNFVYSVLLLKDAVDKLSPTSITEILAKNCRTKNEYLLAEAYLINRIDSDKSLLKKFCHGNDCPTIKFAVDYLKISEPQFKRLKRIGKNLHLIDKFYKMIDLTSEGFLEKIYFLNEASTNHSENLPLVVDCLKILSAKQFREFARNPSYSFHNEPINSRDYIKALPVLKLYDSLISEYKSLDYIILKSPQEVKLLEDITYSLRIHEPYFHRKYKDIPWPGNIEIIEHDTNSIIILCNNI
jgi:hypothetical protein